MKRYNDFSSSVKQMFGKRVQKVSIDAGFTCPNRDGKVGKGGCFYCNNVSFTPSYTSLKISVSEQISEGITFFEKRYDSISFLAYFQAYSNTYAPIEVLRVFFDEALSNPKIIGLVIATRPDCLPEEVLDLLGEYAKDHYVMLEMGIESINNETLENINRGHSYEDAVRAIEGCRSRGIRTCGHLILGLPGEDREEVLRQAVEISKLPIDNLKLHQLQIHRNTVFESQYLENPEMFDLFTLEEYVELIVDYLELLDPDIVVERFVSFAPKNFLIAPKWGLKNFEFVDKVKQRLEERDSYQGRLFNGSLTKEN